MNQDIERYFDSHLREIYERVERLESLRDTESKALVEKLLGLATKLAILEERCQWQGAIAGAIMGLAFSALGQFLKK